MRQVARAGVTGQVLTCSLLGGWLVWRPLFIHAHGKAPRSVRSANGRVSHERERADAVSMAPPGMLTVLKRYLAAIDSRQVPSDEHRRMGKHRSLVDIFFPTVDSRYFTERCSGRALEAYLENENSL